MAGDTPEIKLPYAHRLDSLVQRNIDRKKIPPSAPYQITKAVKETEAQFPGFTFAEDKKGLATRTFFEKLGQDRNAWGEKRADIEIDVALLMVDGKHEKLAGCSEDDLRSFLDFAADISIASHTMLLGNIRRSKYYDLSKGHLMGIGKEHERRIRALEKLQKDLGERASPTPQARRK